MEVSSESCRIWGIYLHFHWQSYIPLLKEVDNLLNFCYGLDLKCPQRFCVFGGWLDHVGVLLNGFTHGWVSSMLNVLLGGGVRLEVARWDATGRICSYPQLLSSSLISGCHELSSGLLPCPWSQLFSLLKQKYLILKEGGFVLAYSLWRFQCAISWLPGRAAWQKGIAEEKQCLAGMVEDRKQQHWASFSLSFHSGHKLSVSASCTHGGSSHYPYPELCQTYQ